MYKRWFIFFLCVFSNFCTAEETKQYKNFEAIIPAPKQKTFLIGDSIEISVDPNPNTEWSLAAPEQAPNTKTERYLIQGHALIPLTAGSLELKELSVVGADGQSLGNIKTFNIQVEGILKPGEKSNPEEMQGYLTQSFWSQKSLISGMVLLILFCIFSSIKWVIPFIKKRFFKKPETLEDVLTRYFTEFRKIKFLLIESEVEKKIGYFELTTWLKGLLGLWVGKNVQSYTRDELIKTLEQFKSSLDLKQLQQWFFEIEEIKYSLTNTANTQNHLQFAEIIFKQISNLLREKQIQTQNERRKKHAI